MAVRAAANGYLTALLLNLPAALASDATWLQLQDRSVSPCRDVQDFMGPDIAVPEPASLALLGVCLAAVGLRRRARRRP